VQVALRDILRETKTRAREDILGKNPSITTSKKFNSRLDLDRIGPESKTWYEIDDVVAVFADLRGSTNLNKDSNKATVASIYEGSTGGIVSIFRKFDPKYIQVQGDGVLALFWGDKHYENAICAAITVKTFGKDVEQFIQDKKNDKSLVSGYRIGAIKGAQKSSHLFGREMLLITL
jgi:class 3 adenylate cyclase